MDIKQLLYFVTVVNEGNITAVSKKLHIAQPALSNQIKNLEKDLNVKLFHRGPRKIILTEAGEILFNKANNILELKYSIRKELEDNKSGFKGILKFNKKYNKIKYEIYEEITPEIISLLFSRVIDIGIVPMSSKGLIISK